MLFRYLDTIKYLKPVQLYGRLLFILKRKLFTVGRPGYLCNMAMELKHFHSSIPANNLNFSFLGQSKTFNPTRIPWSADNYASTSEVPVKLWRYHLNYFEFINSNNQKNLSKHSLFLILDWIQRNENPCSETWEPYPLSKRISSWVKWLEANKDLENDVKYCIHESIFLQCMRLEFDLEFHNQANHLLENLKSLFSSSVYLLVNTDKNLSQVINWISLTTNFIIDEISEQFFADGGHYERSPMYHKEMLEAVETIYKSAKILLPIIESRNYSIDSDNIKKLLELCENKLPFIREWLTLLTHPDGHIALFNDSVYLTGRTPLEQNNEKAISSILPDSGYFVRLWNNAYFALSCGSPSPSFQPGHSHCDITSYELSINKIRCIVDSGCGSYQDKEIRQLCRTTSSHNVALIENSEQSDIWEFFRIGKRAKVQKFKWDSEKSLISMVYIDHNNQKFTREIIFSKSKIKIRDRLFDRAITGTFCSMIHFSPEVVIMPSDDNKMSFLAGSAEFQIITEAKTRFTTSTYFPEFGVKIQSQKLILSNHISEAIDYVITW